MSGFLNKATLIGNLGQDPEVGLKVRGFRGVRHDVDVGADGKGFDLAFEAAIALFGNMSDCRHCLCPMLLSPGTIPCDGGPCWARPARLNPQGRSETEDRSTWLFCSEAAARSRSRRRGQKPGAMVLGETATPIGSALRAGDVLRRCLHDGTRYCRADHATAGMAA